jgi:FkbM family methyltransferase
MAFISYGQNYEDVILSRALRDVERGFYVDVGAADPEEDSVTCAFYERGWSGINIEPLDEYIDKLTQARPRDTNLKVAVGREVGLRIFHAFAGTGLSTLDPEVAARYEAAGLPVSQIVVPVLPLAKILEDCLAPTIHFLKIDVAGAEAEALEGLDLKRARPWIILIDATESNSRVIARENWEHLVTSRGYSLAYFDGLNCFYVADEVSQLKERLAVPPNVFDDFVRFPEWSEKQKAARLEQELGSLQGHTRGLEEAFRAEQMQSIDLYNALQTEQSQTARLRNALQTERMHTTSARTALQAEQAEMRRLLGQLETNLAVLSHYRGVFGALREIGDRFTGGGGRNLAKNVLVRAKRHPRLMALVRAVLKPFPKLSANLYRLKTTVDSPAVPEAGLPSAPPPTDPLPPESSETPASLPTSARQVYLQLRTAISDRSASDRSARTGNQ